MCVYIYIYMYIYICIYIYIKREREREMCIHMIIIFIINGQALLAPTLTDALASRFTRSITQYIVYNQVYYYISSILCRTNVYSTTYGIIIA